MKNQKKYSNEDIIKALKKCYALNNNNISLALYSSTIGYPSPDLIRRRFGSWNQALEEAGLPIYKKRKHREVMDKNYKYSKEFIVEQLKDCYETHGQLTGTLFDNEGYVPSSRTISLQFGSWKAAVEASGLPVETGNTNQFTRDEAIEQLRSFYIDNNMSISKRSYGESGRTPKIDTIRKYFGTWNKALEEAGLSTRKNKVNEDVAKEVNIQTKNKSDRNSELKYNKVDIVNILRQFYHLNGHISIEFYEETGQRPNPTTIIRRFGSWGNALREAGLVFDVNEKQYTKEDVMAEIRRCYQENGKKINSQIYLAGNYRPALTTINKIFGSWKKAVKEAGYK